MSKKTALAGKPAFIIAGTHSGCGKTTLTLGIMAALRKKGLVVQPFKCGPDFIDPTLHRLITGKVSRNLDLWMCGEDFVQSCFADHVQTGDVAVIEGVMGLFDGRGSSSAALSKVLGLPVVLVVDARSTAESMAAVVKGFETLDPELRLAGVIFNRVGSPRHLELLTNAVKQHCQAGILGHLPREVEFTIPERHLGLHTGDEVPLSKAAIEQLAMTVTEHIDLDGLLGLTGRGKAYQGVSSITTGKRVIAGDRRVRLGVARDRAFCFYYEDNLDLLRQAGADLEFFSPLEESELPEGVAGLYLGGGYPELYADKLAANKSMLGSIRELAKKGLPIYAECGGFMYLTEGIYDNRGQLHQMAGVFPVTSRMARKRSSLGYRQVTLQDDFFFGSAGTILRGHEFHYSLIDEMPHQINRIYALNNNTREGYRYNNVLGSYMHLHFAYTPDAAAQFVNMCKKG